MSLSRNQRSLWLWKICVAKSGFLSGRIMGSFWENLWQVIQNISPSSVPPISGDGSHIRNETKSSKCQKYPDRPLLDCRAASVLKSRHKPCRLKSVFITNMNFSIKVKLFKHMTMIRQCWQKAWCWCCCWKARQWKCEEICVKGRLTKAVKNGPKYPLAIWEDIWLNQQTWILRVSKLNCWQW